jgi:hypothetical protein
MTINTATKIYTALDMQMNEMFASEANSIHQPELELEAYLECMANECMRTGAVEVSGVLVSILTAVKDADVNWVHYATQMLDPMMARVSTRDLQNRLRPVIIEFIRQVYVSEVQL